jgi:RNA polymerase sigma-70 factor (ECF subfamily)
MTTMEGAFWPLTAAWAESARDVASEEERLVLQSQAGDMAAFQRLVQLYQRKVYGIAYGMVRNRDDAMDLTQDAFIKVHKNLKRFKGSSSFYTWLYRIVRNLCIDHLRRTGRQRASEYDDARAPSVEAKGSGLLPDRVEMSPSDVLQRREQRALLEQALAQLSPTHRAVLLLREVEGLSYSELAETLDCAKGTVMSRLFHARRNMQRALIELSQQSQPASGMEEVQEKRAAEGGSRSTSVVGADPGRRAPELRSE